MYCLCCCCRKKKSTNDYEEINKKQPKRSNPYPDASVQNVNINSLNVPPPNYQTMRPYNFGGTADLYQNVTQTRNLSSPPSYQSLDAQNTQEAQC